LANFKFGFRFLAILKLGFRFGRFLISVFGIWPFLTAVFGFPYFKIRCDILGLTQQIQKTPFQKIT
jgi:hypothetical protein